MQQQKTGPFLGLRDDGMWYYQSLYVGLSGSSGNIIEGLETELLGPRSNLTIGQTYLEAGELGILGNVVSCYTKKGKARQG